MKPYIFILIVLFYCQGCFLVKECDESFRTQIGKRKGYFLNNTKQTLVMPSGKVVTISLAQVKPDTFDYFFADDGCKANRREISILEKLKTDDTLIKELSIRHSFREYSDIQALKINNWVYKNHLPFSHIKSINIQNKTYYDLENINMAQYDINSKKYIDSIQVMYSVNDGFVKIIVDSAKQQVYELVP